MTDREQSEADSARDEQFHRFWFAHVEALASYLDRMDESPAKKIEAVRKRSGSSRESNKGESK